MSTTLSRVIGILDESITNKARLRNEGAEIVARIADALVAGLRDDRRVYIMGNGGSAADAQHFAAELVGRFRVERAGLPAIALSTNTSSLTAIGNDYGFDFVFVRQVAALVRRGDVVIGISTSGNSPNVITALEKAKEIGAVTIGLSGETGGKLAGLCELCVRAPGLSSDRVQECHIAIIHTICQIVEESLFPPSA